MLDREIEQTWSVVKESYPNAIVFQEAEGLYFVRGRDTAILEKEFGIESGSRWYAFDELLSAAYMQELSERGYSVVRATNCGVLAVRPRPDRRSYISEHRAKGCFRMLSPSLLFDSGEVERATNVRWLERHNYIELFESFKSWLAGEDCQAFRSYGEVYVYEVADWYEIDRELTSMLETHVLLLAKAALATHCKMPCKVVEPNARRTNGATPKLSHAMSVPALSPLGQQHFDGW